MIRRISPHPIETESTTGEGEAQQTGDASPSRGFTDSVTFQQSMPPLTAVAELTDRFAASGRRRDSLVRAVIADPKRMAEIGASDCPAPSAMIAATGRVQPSSLVIWSNPFNGIRENNATNNSADLSSRFNPSFSLPPTEAQSQTSQLNRTSQLCGTSSIGATQLPPTLL
jgi:hypothetical protein